MTRGDSRGNIPVRFLLVCYRTCVCLISSRNTSELQQTGNGPPVFVSVSPNGSSHVASVTRTAVCVSVLSVNDSLAIESMLLVATRWSDRLSFFRVVSTKAANGEMRYSEERDHAAFFYFLAPAKHK